MYLIQDFTPHWSFSTTIGYFTEIFIKLLFNSCKILQLWNICVSKAWEIIINYEFVSISMDQDHRCEIICDYFLVVINPFLDFHKSIVNNLVGKSTHYNFFMTFFKTCTLKISPILFFFTMSLNQMCQYWKSKCAVNYFS